MKCLALVMHSRTAVVARLMTSAGGVSIYREILDFDWIKSVNFRSDWFGYFERVNLIG
jgi:hypothetical protein